MNTRRWRYLRQLVQLLALGLFLYLFVAMTRELKSPVPVNLFSRLDLLLALSSMVAARRFIIKFAPALIVALATLAFGRFWCGWICPLGTILNLFGPVKRDIPQKLRQAKYYILFTILFAALLANLTLVFLDPITIFLRAMAGVIYPGIKSAFEKGAKLPIQPALIVPFAVILALNLIVRRFWCRYLCPLGALMGLLSKVSWFKRYVERMEEIAPCRVGCPAGTNVTGYVALISQGRFKEAVDLIREANPFPTVCGHVCPHRCEDECNRGEFDEPLAINALERFAADYVLKSGEDKPKPTPITRKERVAIIGSGPAGLSAAYHLRRMGYRVKVFERLPLPGGMLAVGIPRYRLPREVLQKDIGYIEGSGVEIETNVEVDKQRFEQIRREYDAVFISVGAHKSRKLKVEGEDLEGVVHGVDFLRDLNLGREVRVGKKVAVIGGGDVAIDVARCALRLGSEVTIFYRRSRKEMPARMEEVEEAEEEGVKIEYLVTPTRFIGKNGKVAGMECIRMKLGAPDETGRPRPIPIEGSEFTVDADTVILAIGQSSELDFLEGSGVETQRGRIVTDSQGMTTQSGIFAGGDAVTGPATVAEAVGMGRRAAIAIDRYLRGEPLPKEEEIKTIKFEEIPRDKLPKEKKARTRVSKIPLERRKESFDEVRMGLSREEAMEEAGRCLNWSCAGCANCVPRCPMDTISEEDFSSDPAECIMCLNCLGSCPMGATKVGRKPGLNWGYEYDPSRRQLLASLATGVLGALLLRTKLFRWKSPHLLRPPGARPEEEFLAKCVHCGQCLKVCPNHALRPTLLEAGLEGFWTPMLVPRSGFCDYDCNACGQVCPTGAIPALPLEEKRKQVIGTAYVNRDRCISCMMCKGVCPVGAIEEVEGEREGMPALFPQVNPDLCIGCGTCEYTCPVEGEAAIRVYAPGARPVRPAPPPVPTPTPEATKAPEKTPTPEETPAIKASEKRAYVNRDLCLRCFICVMLCPQHAIEKVMVDDVEYPHVIVEKCIGCGICEENCPAEPKAIRLYAPEELPESWRPLTRRA